MKKHVRTVLLATAALAAVVSAQAALPAGDLIIGFTSGSGLDFELDLGQASSLTSTPIDLHSQLAGFNLSTVNWGVVGTATAGVGGARTSWATLLSGNIASNARWSQVNSAVTGIGNQFATGAGPGSSATPDAVANSFSWNQETVVGGGAAQYLSVNGNPNTIGLGSAELFATTVGIPSPVFDVGTFTLSGNGILTFTAVPEPSTYGVLAGLGLLALCLRRQFANKAA
jgi:hypothetical protein